LSTEGLDLVAQRDVENSSHLCSLYERIDTFARLKVSKHFGISFVDFIELPSDVCKQILKVSAKMESKKEEDAETLLNTFNLNN
jgi:hypothetical protein